MSHSILPEITRPKAEENIHTILSVMSEYEDYLRNERRSAESTIAAYLSDLRRLGTEIGKDVSKITLNDLRDYQRLLGQYGRKTATVQRKFDGFRTFWKWLILQGYAQENVAERIRIPRRKPTIPYWLTEAELVKFVSTPVQRRYHHSENERLREEVAWKILAWLGLRRSELLNLRVENVYLEERRVEIIKSKGDRNRTLPLPERLYPLLKKLIANRPETEFVFSGHGKGGRWGLTSFMAGFRQHVKNCGLNPNKVKPHTLRHTFATHLSLRDVRIEVIQQLLGHADLKTTRIYLHTRFSDLQIALDDYILNSIQAIVFEGNEATLGKI